MCCDTRSAYESCKCRNERKKGRQPPEGETSPPEQANELRDKTRAGQPRFVREELLNMPLSTSSKVFAAIALMGALLSSCSSSPPARAAGGAIKDRKPAPDFTLTNANGIPVNLSDYKRKVVLLNFWATWCGPCKIEIPWFIEFEKMYQDRGFATVGVSMDEDGWQSVKPFVKQNAMNYAVMIGNERVAQLYGGIDALPSTFLIDREGRIAFVHFGLVSKHDYEAEILQLIAQ